MSTQQMLIAIFLCSAPTIALAQEQRGTTLWEWTDNAVHHESIVQVSIDGATGTGVIIGVDYEQPSGGGYLGQCVTANHVVHQDAGRNAIRILYRNGRVAKDCQVISKDEKLDIALLKVWVPAEVPVARIAAVEARPGDRIELTGLGGGSELDCCLRHFRAVAADPTDASQIFASVSLLPGDSGGAVFNADSELIGIVSGGWFWWHDKRLRQKTQPKMRATWPARACNLRGLRTLIATAKETPQESRTPEAEPEIQALADVD